MSVMSCIVVGDESLLVQCSEVLLANGHTICAVVTHSDDIRAWADDRGLRVEAHGADLADRLGPVTCDWLFSIANLVLIPETVLSKATQGAVNFHDGPLPRYAGLNAPVWAILNGEAQHGITWHLIENGVDEGDILAQRIFDIAPDETALTLNTKCYEAAIESFDDVVSQLAGGAPSRQAQDLSQRSYFARDARPSAGGRIDFNADSGTIASLVRGLDHGGYFNPLTLPKVEIDGDLYVVTSASEAEPANAGQVPGTVRGASAETLEVATGQGTVQLSGLKTLDGRKADLKAIVSVGDVLPSLDQQVAEGLSQILRPAARSDGFWRRAFDNFSPIKLPTVAQGKGKGIGKISVQVPDGADLLPAVAVWAAQMVEEVSFGLAYVPCDPVGNDIAAPYVSPWVPLNVQTGTDTTGTVSFADLATALTSARADMKGKYPFARDLLLRAPELLGMAVPDIAFSNQDVTVDGAALTVCAGEVLELAYDIARVPEEMARVLAGRLEHVLKTTASGTVSATAIRHIPMLSEAERRQIIHDWNATTSPYPSDVCVHHLFEDQSAKTPDAVAVVFEAEALTYAELNSKANRVAHVLAEMGVERGSLVGLHTTRSLDLLIGALAIQKAGGAYVPLDPAYPADRVALYIEDSGAEVIIAQSELARHLPAHKAKVLEIDKDPRMASASDSNPESGVTSSDLAYLIFTSGSTGRPKGVMVEHRNVANFFTGMDERIPHEPAGVWLAVTSLSFDISVLELFYTLARGFKIVLSSDENRALASSGQIAITDRKMDFSLYYWGNDDGAGAKKYELLLEGAKFADRNGFCAVWTPERHFHAFGGPYPNPSVTGAAVAAVTENIGVRGGSCVAPLHHPARIAEEWAVIDNLTNGKAGMAIASGWQPDDFVLRPENTPPDNKPAMFDAIDKVRKLWRGEAVEFPKRDGTMHAVVTQPRPVSEEMPVWVTTAGNPATWKEAGAYGANVLTHLLGQSVKEVEEKIKIYHEALRDAGHEPAERTVTLMLHTFVGEDREVVRETAREPMKDYLRSAAGLIKQYAWAFPAFKKPEGATNAFDIDLGSLDQEEMEGILDFAFQRYFEDSGLFGTVQDCVARVESLKRIGVDEIACLIDYGIAVEDVMEGLKPLAEVLRLSNMTTEIAEDDFSIAAQILRHDVSHLQCTPSMARMLMMNDEARFALSRISTMMVGGEPLPGALVRDLKSATNARLENMYGPTETTIWSSTETASAEDGIVNIGTPIANTQLYVLDANRQPVPIGVAGELYIGGAGVTRGYWQRDDLTTERFLPDPFSEVEGGRMYRTGDLVRWRFDGKVEFIGRVDHQVKIRGYRIELGEIEARLEDIAGIRQAVVTAREDVPGNVRLVGYIRSDGPVAVEDVRAQLGTNLPDFMVPTHIVRLDDFPLTPNKKVDRNALPAPEERRAEQSEAAPEAPKNDVEAQIAEIWKRVLGVATVSSKDNFFDIGGHSLLAVQAHREIKMALNAPKLSITDIFRYPTLDALARHLGGELVGSAPAKAAVDVAPAADRANARADAMSRRRAMRARRHSGSGA
ncbi:MupA/Atu3671 family FMN-dependent luciferase-like monooxygenase [Algicella marina]|uniref:LLM class flavin-dependent oxidoreductase n=1 Tax=Algicella marina TaxID=2683284 RepID=A0A6P1SUI3_9RHOB|nr:MupA/Atu3671 family FMN-dependent luciferase-like monooxygenase [Algicella marina]QHQ34098.1 LLM class flavin-dependent oxidoreductase [Algicella marina]